MGHAKRVPDNKLVVEDKPLWYLPHHPVFNPSKPGKTRVVFVCTAKFRGMSLNDQLLSGPDLTNSIVGMLTRFRQEQVALAADTEPMFHQVRVSPDNYDVFRFLWCQTMIWIKNQLTTAWRFTNLAPHCRQLVPTLLSGKQQKMTSINLM